MNNIKHIVYLMLENRSFDSVLGYLYENDSPEHFIPVGNKNPFDGINKDCWNPDKLGNQIPAFKINPAPNIEIPSVDPNEEFQHVQKQMKNNMKGFFLDYSIVNSQHTKEIMACYSPASLPVLNSLAKQFAVSDWYFSSIPTQTNCNRAFSLTGNSIGSYDSGNSHKRTAMVNNYWLKSPPNTLDPYQFTERCIFQVLEEEKIDWAVFYNQKWPGISIIQGNYCFTQDLLWPTMKNYSNKFKGIEEFYAHARQGTLPSFSYLEPAWYEEWNGYGHNGNDYHPPGNVSPGEKFLYQLYQQLKSSPNWKNTLLIINFDEHGGTYDHITPPGNVNAPWQNPADGTQPPDDYDITFGFTQLGVRVPLILVSPLIDAKTIFRPLKNENAFDHTSVIATILKHFNIDKSKWQLGSRVANAPTFEHVITLTPETARMDAEVDAPIDGTSIPATQTAPTELQRMIIHRMLHLYARQRNIHSKAVEEIHKKYCLSPQNMPELGKQVQNAIDALNQL